VKHFFLLIKFDRVSKKKRTKVYGNFSSQKAKRKKNYVGDKIVVLMKINNFCLDLSALKFVKLKRRKISV
jgi:hypothetical protein